MIDKISASVAIVSTISILTIFGIEMAFWRAGQAQREWLRAANMRRESWKSDMERDLDAALAQRKAARADRRRAAEQGRHGR